MNKNNLMDEDSQGNLTEMLRVNADRATVYPVVEMAGNRVNYLNEILYLYLEETELSEGLNHS